MESLFQWASLNAKAILQEPTLRENFKRFLCSGGTLEVHEDYAGMGTCGACLVEQFNAMKSEVAAELPARSMTKWSFWFSIIPIPFLFYDDRVFISSGLESRCNFEDGESFHCI